MVRRTCNTVDVLVAASMKRGNSTQPHTHTRSATSMEIMQLRHAAAQHSTDTQMRSTTAHTNVCTRHAASHTLTRHPCSSSSAHSLRNTTLVGTGLLVDKQPHVARHHNQASCSALYTHINTQRMLHPAERIQPSCFTAPHNGSVVDLQHSHTHTGTQHNVLCRLKLQTTKPVRRAAVVTQAGQNTSTKSYTHDSKLQY